MQDTTTISKKKHHTPILREKKLKEDLKQSSQSHYNSQFNLNKQAYAQHKNTLHKEQSDAPCNFVKLYHLCMMKIALIKEEQRKNQHHLKILSIHNEEDLSHQNRGESSEIRR